LPVTKGIAEESGNGTSPATQCPSTNVLGALSWELSPGRLLLGGMSWELGAQPYAINSSSTENVLGGMSWELSPGSFIGFML